MQSLKRIFDVTNYELDSPALIVLMGPNNRIAIVDIQTLFSTVDLASEEYEKMLQSMSWWRRLRSDDKTKAGGV
jgi:hypothetical protein